MPLWIKLSITHSKGFIFVSISFRYHWTHCDGKSRDRRRWWCAAEMELLTPVCSRLDALQSPRLFRILFWTIVVCSATKSCLILCNPMDCSTPGFLFLTISLSLFKLISMESVILSNHVILCCPLLLLPSIFPSIRVFSNESPLQIRWPKYWSFSISPSSEYSGLIYFRINCFDLLDVQGTLKSLLQHHNLKASILQCSAFFMIQFSHPYMTTGKTIALSRWTFRAITQDAITMQWGLCVQAWRV